MAAIITGNTLGISNATPIHGGKQDNTAAAGRGSENVYVNIANGNLVVQRQDELLASRGTDVGVLRTYNSQGQFDGDNNDNWRIGFYRQIKSLTGTVNTAGSTVIRVRADGAEQIFTSNGSVYVSTDGDGAHDTLAFSNGQWLFTDGSSRATETYDWDNGAGKLLLQTDASGNATAYTYNASGLLAAVADASGETVFLDYTGANLTAVRTVRSDASTSTRVRYAYDSLNRLAQTIVDLSPDDNSVADGKTYVTSYTYDGPSLRIATLTQSDGTALAFAYTADGKVASLTDALGNVTTYAYDTLNARTTVTDALGNASTYAYDTAGRVSTVTSPAVNGVSTTTAYTWDASGNLTGLTDGEGNSVVMQYDANGNLTLQRDAGGNTITRAYDANNQLVSETVYLAPDPDGPGAASAGTPLTTRHAYSTSVASRLRFTISAEGRVTEYRYDAYGRRSAEIAYRGNLYTGATSSEADLQAWVASADRTQSQRTDYAYDFRGQLASSTAWSSVDASGNGVAGTAAVTSYVYGPNGQLLQTIAPLGGAAQATSYTYDGLGRMLTATDGLGRVTSSVYDDAGNRTTITAANGLAIVNTYDAAGRLVSTLQTGSGVNATTRYYYDADNQLRMTRDALGNTSWNLYDAAGRQVGTIDGNGSLIEAVYDRSGNVVKTIAYANTVNTALLTMNTDGSPSAAALALTLADLRPASGADQVAWNVYDLAGRLVKTVDAGGAVTENVYDGDSRLVQTIAYANPIATATLPAQPSAAQVAPVADAANDRVTRTFFDADGLQRAVLDAEGYLTEILYNGAGAAWKTVAYANATASNLRATGTLDALRPAASSADVAGYTLYDARGQAVGAIDAEGYLTETSFDANGNVTQTKRYATALPAAMQAGITTATSVATVRPAASAQDQVQSYTYDARNRVSTSTDSNGTVTTYAYDAAGNVVSTTMAYGTTEARTGSATFDALGRQTSSIDGRNKTTSYQYDALGNMASSTDALGRKTLYYYDADGNLACTINALGEVTGTRWNNLGQKIAFTEYGTRIASATLATMNGGLLDAVTQTRIDSLANTAIDGTTSYTYNLDGTLASMTDAEGNITLYGYNGFDEQTSVTVPMTTTSNSVTTLAYDRRGLLVTKTIDPTGLALTSSTQYDAFGRTLRSTNARGGHVQFAYDRLGRQLQITDAGGGQTSTVYDAYNRVLSQTDALGRTTTTSYDDANRRMTVTTPEGISVTTTRNRHGQICAVTDGLGNTSTYSYDAAGNLTGVTKPINTSTSASSSVTYGDTGLVLTSTDAGGIVTSYSYDAVGRVLTRVVDPDRAGHTGLKLTTSYSYDARGRTVTTTDARGVVTSSQYDRKGQLTSSTVDPTGLNLVTRLSYDGSGRQVSMTDASGTVTQYTYDQAGRRISQQLDPTGLNLTTQYAYDGNDNLVSVTDPGGNVTRNVYDAKDQLTYSVDGANGVTRYEYDAVGNLTRQTRYAIPIAAGAAPNTVQPWNAVPGSASDQVTRNVYDRDNRLTYSADGAGSVTRYEYDANGNIVRTTAFATAISTTAAPDSVAASASDRITRNVYDGLNRLCYSVDAAGAVTQYDYDANGNVVRTTAYATTIGATDAPGAVLSSSADRIVRNVYDAANRLTFSADATGAVSRYSYDGAGNIVSRTDYATLVAANAAPDTVQASGRDRVTLNVFDAANRMTYSVDPTGAVTRYDYDADGNVTRRTAFATPIAATATPASVLSTFGADQVTTNSYDAANRLVRSVDSIGAITDYSYDANGKLTGSTSYAQATNLALNKLATQSSTPFISNTANVAIDNSTSSSGTKGLALTSSEANAWWQVDLLASQNISTIELYNGTGSYSAGLSDFTVFVSDFDFTRLPYSSILSDSRVRKFSYTGEAPSRLTIAAFTTGRYVRVQLSGAGALSLAEVRVNGYTPRASSADRTVSYEYDAAGRQTRTLYPNTAVYTNETAAQLAANGANGVASRVETSSTVYSQSWYDTFDNVVARRDTAGNMSYLAWDAAGRLVYEVDAAGYVTGRQYDALGNIAAITRYAGKIADATFAAWGTNAPSAATIASLLSNTSVNNRTTTMQYDKTGRVVLETRPAVYAYDLVNGVMTGATASPTTRTTYNAFGDIIRKEDLKLDSSWNSSWTYYDNAGRSIATVDALNYLTTRSYDAFGNVTQITEYANAASNASAAAYTAPATSAQDRTVRYTWDGNNHKLSETRVGVEYMASTSQAGVTLYSDPNYAGNSVSFGPGWYALDSGAYAVNAFQLSSLRVSTGWKVTLYARTGFSGAWTTVTGDTPDLSGSSFNDKTVCISVLNGTTTTGDLATTYHYDAFGNLIKTTDASNSSSYTWYDTANRIRAVVDPSRQGTSDGSTLIGLTQYTRDAFGNVIEQTDRALGANTVDSRGFTFTSSSDDRVSSTRYDTRGRKIEVTDALGNKQYFSYDANDNLVKQWQGVTGNTGSTRTVYTETTYDARGNVVYLNESGKETQFAYNGFGELTSRGGKAGNSASLGWQELFVYDNGGRLWKSNARDGVMKVMLYDLQNNFTADIRSDSQDLTFKTAAEVNALAGTRRVVTRYDALGRNYSQDLANNATVTQEWDRWGNRLSVSDARNANWKTTYTYNSNNQVTNETLPAVSTLGGDLSSIGSQNPVTDYFYDAAGNLVAQRDARGGITRKSWDAMGNLLAEFNADGSSVRHYYDGYNQEVQRVDAMGNATGYAYDKMGRLTTVSRATAAFYDIEAASVDLNASQADSPVTLYDGTASSGNKSFFGSGNYTGLTKTFDSVRVLQGYKLDMWNDAGQIQTYKAFTGTVVTDLPSNMKNRVVRVVVTRMINSTVHNPEAVVSQVLNGVSQLSYTYDELGRRLSASDARGAAGTTYYSYDLAGHVTGVRQPGDTANSTSYQYDAAGYKSGETDAAGNTMSWVNDYFGRAQTHGTLDDKTTTYTYDYAGQVKTEVNTGGRNVTTTWNTAGQIIKIVDKLTASSTRTTIYAYDTAGNRTRETTNIDTSTYQDETLTYDALGRLASATDIYGSTYASVAYTYDAMGNRMRQSSAVNLTQNSATGATTKATYFAYDAQNRMLLVDGALNNDAGNSANLTSSTGRRVTYDANGNRIKEESSGVTNIYMYDALNRMTYAFKNGSLMQLLKYDLADRLLESIDNTQASETAANHVINLYDARGRMSRQWHRANSVAAPDGTITSGADDSTTFYTYDAVGNMIKPYTQRFGDHMFHTDYYHVYTRLGDRYVRTQINGKRYDSTSSNNGAGTSTFTYDYNGYLTNFADSAASSNNRSYQTNVSGQILRRSGSAGTTKIMLANGQQLGSYASTGDIDFNLAYQVVDSAHPATGPGTYEVNAGDTLQGIAFNTYGDRAMWYLIADANGLRSDSVLTTGMSLKLPSVVGSARNNAQTFKPIDSASIIGVTDPTIAPPNASSNTCKTVSIIVAAVVASIVVSMAATALTVFTLGALGVPALSAAGVVISLLFAAAAGAVSSMVSQGIMIAGGLQDHMNWSDVATSALSEAATGGIGMAFGAVVRAAVRASSASRAAAVAAEAVTQSRATVSNASKVMQYVQRLSQGATRIGQAAKQKGANFITEIYGANSETRALQKAMYETQSGSFRAPLREGWNWMKQSAGRLVFETAEGMAEEVSRNSIEQGIAIATGKRQNFDRDYLVQSMLTGGIQFGKHAKSAAAEEALKAKLKRDAQDLTGSIKSIKPSRRSRVGKIKTILKGMDQEGGYIDPKQKLGTRAMLRYGMAFVAGMGAVAATGDIYKDRLGIAAMPTGPDISLGALLTLGSLSVSNLFLSRHAEHRAAGVSRLGKFGPGSVSARYTDTNAFQAKQYLRDVSFQLIAGTVLAIDTDGASGSLSTMQERAGYDMTSTAYHHMARNS